MDYVIFAWGVALLLLLWPLFWFWRCQTRLMRQLEQDACD